MQFADGSIYEVKLLNKFVSLKIWKKQGKISGRERERDGTLSIFNVFLN